MVNIPYEVLCSIQLQDENIDSAIDRRTAEAEELRASIEIQEKRIAADLGLSALGLKRIFTNTPSLMEFNAHERENRGRVFLGKEMEAAFKKIDDDTMRLRIARFTVEGLRLLKAARAANPPPERARDPKAWFIRQPAH